MEPLNHIQKKGKGIFRFIKSLNLLGRVVLILIIGVGAWFVYGLFSKSTEKPTYQTAKVEKGTIISTVSGSGNVSSNQVTVVSPTNGVIEELYVTNGDQVTVGQNLFKVKSTATKEEQASAYASYQSAVSSLTSAKNTRLSLDATMWSVQQKVLDAQNAVDYKNGNSINPSTKNAYTDLEKQSIDSGLIQAKKDFTANEQKYKDADAAVTSAQAQLTSAWLSYQSTQTALVTAPTGGSVANIAVTIGSSVTASTGTNSNSSTSSSSQSSTTTASTILVIGDFNALQIKVPVSEVDASGIHTGDNVTVTLDAMSGKTFVGTVSSIDTVGTIASGVVTYNAYITFSYAPEGILPGMSATAVIQTERHDDVLLVPTTAVQTANGDKTVRVLKNGNVTQATVETGIQSDTQTEIISGLSLGDTIVTGTSTTTGARTGTTGTSPFSGIGGFGGARGGR